MEQTNGRTTELEVAKHEVDILNAASQELIRASTPAEILEAVSAYPRSIGSTSGHLFYFKEQKPGFIELIAEWSLIDVQRLSQRFDVGWKLDVSDRTLGRYWLERPTRPTLIPDVMNSEIVGADSRATMSGYDIHGFVALPLNNKGRWIGVLYFYWNTPHTFNERDERILATVQRLANPVIDSIQLLEQARKRTLELERANQEVNLLYRASEVINAANTYAEVVEAVAQFDLEADVVTLMLWENFDWETATYLEVVVVLDRAGAGKLVPGIRLRKEDFPIAYQMFGEHVWLFEDALTDPRIDPLTAQSWAALDIRAFMGPAFYVRNRWIGGITFHSTKPRQYSQREVRLFAGIGDLAQAAIERVRLREATEAARQAAVKMAEQAQKLAALEERTRLARELHDSVSQVLYGIGLGARTARALMIQNPARLNEPLDYILALAEAGLTEMRALIFELRPESLEEEGLITALTKQVASLQSRHGIQVHTKFCDEPPLAIETKSDLYRIAREALYNALKHAQATQIMLSFVETEGGYHLEISDNGLGFDPTQSFPGHLGLKSMRERMESLDGFIHIESSVGTGTRISAIISC